MISEHDSGDCVANCGDVLIRHWHDGEGGALDVTVTGPLSKTNVRAAAAEAGISLSKASHRKVQGAAVVCQQQGLILFYHLQWKLLAESTVAGAAEASQVSCGSPPRL